MGTLSLGIDMGTTAVKAAVLDGDGSVVAFGRAPTRLHRGAAGLAEQDPQEMYEDALNAVRDALEGTSLGNDIESVAFSSQGGTVMILDAQGTPLIRAISWMDARPKRLGPATLLGKKEDFFYEKCGWSPAFGGLPLSQIVRLKKEDERLIRRAGGIRFVDSYMVERFTGEAVSSPSDAAITLLWNVRNGRWDGDILNLVGITEEILPRVEQSGTVAGKIRPGTAQVFGISPKAQVVVGGHDQYCAAFGAGCTGAGDVIVSCGTAWVLLAMTSGPVFDSASRLAPARAVSGDLWGLLGSAPAAGASLDWFRRAASPDGGEIPFEELENAARDTEPGAGGAAFATMSEKNAKRGRFVGLSLDQGFGHLARAVLEGAATDARILLDRMKTAGVTPSALKAVGGATRSAVWMQILSDAAGLPLEIAGAQDAASFGAALLAGQSTGSIPEGRGWPAPAGRFQPRQEHAEAYKKLKERIQKEVGR